MDVYSNISFLTDDGLGGSEQAAAVCSKSEIDRRFVAKLFTEKSKKGGEKAASAREQQQLSALQSDPNKLVNASDNYEKTIVYLINGFFNEINSRVSTSI